MSTGTSGACEFVFVVWSAARAFAGRIEDELARRFRIVRSFDVTWERRHFAANLAAFYGWRSWHIWRNKARKCGTGPFRVIVVEDPSPIWKCECDTSGHRLNVNANVYGLKRAFRELTGRSNVVHSSVTPEETAHQLAALASPQQNPIPFRPMVYEDDARIRRDRRRVWLGLAADLLVPLSASVLAGAVIWLDLFVLGSKCEENGLVEWSGLAISTICGMMMTACALAAKSGRGAHALLAAFFLDMAIREADLILDRALGAHIWPWALSATTLTFAAVTIRYAKTVYSGLRAMRRSRRFQLFACGASLMLFISQFLGHDAMWRALGVPDAATFSHFIEESVELFGYALMMAWAAPYACRILCAKCRNMV